MKDKNNKILILAKLENKLRLALKLKNGFRHQGKIVTIITDEKNNCISSLGIRYISDYRNNLDVKDSDINQEAHNLIRSLGGAQITDKAKFGELTTYNSISLWAMSVTYMLSELIPIFINFHLLEQILIREIPSEVVILGGAGDFERTLREICIREKIPVTLYCEGNFTLLLKKIVSGIDYTMRRVWRFLKSLHFRLLNFINSFYAAVPNGKPVTVFFTFLSRHFDTLCPIIKKYNPEERLVVDMPHSGCDKKLKIEGISFKYFYGYKIYQVLNFRQHAFLMRIWKTINNNDEFRNKLNHAGINLWEVTEDSFYRLIFRLFPENIYHADVIKKITLAHKVIAAVASDYGGMVLLPARAVGVPTVSVLSSSSEELRYHGEVVSDYVISTGNYWKQSLLCLVDSAEKIFVSGPTKFDSIFNTDFHREGICKELGIDQRNKTIIYFSTPICEPIGFYREVSLREIDMVFKAFKKLKNINLITKLHPYDNNLNVYKKIAKENELKGMLIIRDFNTWKLLSLTDLALANYSTVSYEAVLMGKSVLLLNSSNKYLSNDIWNFKSCNPVVFINDYSELENAIQRILLDPDFQSILGENRKKYILDHAAPLDGRASYRAKESIELVALKK